MQKIEIVTIGLFPPTRNLRPAFEAASVPDLVAHDTETPSLNQGFIARRAKCVFVFTHLAGTITGIDEPQSCTVSDLSRANKG